MTSSPLVLVLETDPQMRALLRLTIEQSGWRVLGAETPADAFNLAYEHHPDLAITAIDPEASDPSAIVSDLQRSRPMPVIAISRRTSRPTLSQLLDAGASDVLLMPISPAELMARARALLRRRYLHRGTEAIQLGDVELDLQQRSLTRDGIRLPIDRTEYLLLQCLVVRAPQVVSHADLLTSIWGMEYRDEISRLRQLVRRLRRRLAEHGVTTSIRTLKDVGYAIDLAGNPGAS